MRLHDRFKKKVKINETLNSIIKKKRRASNKRGVGRSRKVGKRTQVEEGVLTGWWGKERTKKGQKKEGGACAMGAAAMRFPCSHYHIAFNPEKVPVSLLLGRCYRRRGSY